MIGSPPTCSACSEPVLGRFPASHHVGCCDHPASAVMPTVRGATEYPTEPFCEQCHSLVEPDFNEDGFSGYSPL